MLFRKNIDIIGEYDVLVCGCGSAGFPAAVAAARSGAKVCVVEESGMPGGVLTVGGNNHIGLFNKGSKPVIRGIGWELVSRLAQTGDAKIPEFKDGARHSTQGVEVNIVMAAHVMDEMLLECGVDIKYTHKISDVIYEKNNITAVVVSTKTGLKAIKADCFVDATGDGDVAFLSGCRYELGDALQPGTLRFFPMGYDAGKINKESVEQDFIKRVEEGRLSRSDNWTYFGSFKAFSEYGNNINHIELNAADSQKRSLAEIEGRRSLARIYQWMRRQKGAEAMEMLTCSPSVAARESRRIIGETYIKAEDYLRGKQYPDSICYSYYPIDLHKHGAETLENIEIEKDALPSIPLSALRAKEIKNLLVAGRCVGGDRLANSAYRVKASCMAMGHAAGVAAAMSAKEKTALEDLDISKLKNDLSEQNAIVPHSAEKHCCRKIGNRC